MKRSLTLLVTALLLVVPLVACSSSSDQAGQSVSVGQHPIVLVVLDGVRIDRLTGYGAASTGATNLDRFAASAVRFEQAFAQAPQRVPSMASLLTGMYATTHGLVDPGDVLVDEAMTLAEALGGAGYDTAAFVTAGSGVDDLGLAQGFVTFESGSNALDEGLSWMRQHASASFFLMVGPLTATQPATVQEEGADAYDAALARADAEVGRVLDAVDEAGLTDSATVAVVSVVGAELGEHGEPGASTIYTPVVQVPMMLRSPAFAGDSSVSSIVEVVDLMPTLLELAGVETPAEVQGRSMVPLVVGAGTPPYIAFGESPADGGTFFATLAGYGLVVRGEDAELYDLGADPVQLADLAAEISAADFNRLTVLRDHLEAWQKMVSAASLDPERRTEVLDDETLEQLRSLGYIQ